MQSANFRAGLTHANDAVLGFLDLRHARVADCLPSAFMLCCEGCGCEQDVADVAAGSSTVRFCKRCHAKMELTIKRFRSGQPGPS